MNKYTFLILKPLNRSIFLLILSVSSCKNFLDIPSPKGKLIAETVFSNDSTAMAAIRGLFANLSIPTSFASGSASSSITYFSSLSGDDLVTFSTTTNVLQFYRNEISPLNLYIPALWNGPYKTIFEANAIIEGLSQSNGTSVEIKQQLISESKFIRAFSYFYLVNLFGDVPLITSTDYRVNTNIAKVSKEKIYVQIFDDLREAIGALSDSYSYSADERVRPNKFAAMALLSRAYLYTSDWTNAELYASKVIVNNTLYDTVPLSKVFLKNSQEAIWQILPQPGTSAQDGNTFVLVAAPSTGAGSNTVISSDLLAAFETGDNRVVNWIGVYKKNTPPLTTYHFPNKYKTKTAATATEYSTVLRLAEQYLIRAEARIQLGRVEEGIADINIIRNRAGLASLSTSLSKEEALVAIEHERRVELFTEWGHRWLDLKRTGRINTIMPEITAKKGGVWRSEWQLYPIPQTQILSDPSMSNAQNPGYD